MKKLLFLILALTCSGIMVAAEGEQKDEASQKDKDQEEFVEQLLEAGAFLGEGSSVIDSAKDLMDPSWTLSDNVSGASLENHINNVIKKATTALNKAKQLKEMLQASE